MLQIPIVIKLTGLLLLTPNTETGSPPMNVLMPTTRNLAEAHVAQLGFHGDSTALCAHYDTLARICYVDMDGWSMDIGQSGGNPSSTRLPRGTANLSDRRERHVHRNLLGNNPGDTVRSRITIYGGSVTDSCALARWSFNGSPFDMPNVLDWTIPDFPHRQLTLRRRQLNRGGSAREQTIARLRPVNGRIELFIRHIPSSEQNELDAGNTTPSTHRPRPGATADHFGAYFDLLNVPAAQRPSLPVATTVLQDRCSWVKGVAIEAFIDVAASPGTASCMVAGGLPPP